MSYIKFANRTTALPLLATALEGMGLLSKSRILLGQTAESLSPLIERRSKRLLNRLLGGTLRPDDEQSYDRS